MKKVFTALSLFLFSLLAACGGGGGGETDDTLGNTVEPIPQDRTYFSVRMALTNVQVPIGGFQISFKLPAGVEPEMGTDGKPVITFSDSVPKNNLIPVNYKPASSTEAGQLTLAIANAEPFDAGEIAVASVSVPRGQNLPLEGEFEIANVSAYEIKDSGNTIIQVPGAALRLTVQIP